MWEPLGLFRRQWRQSSPSICDVEENKDQHDVRTHIAEFLTTHMPYDRADHHGDQSQCCPDTELRANPSDAREYEPKSTKYLSYAADKMEVV